MQTDVSKTTYGERNPGSPTELGAFAFLVGKWQGTGKVRLPDGNVAEFSGVSWIRAVHILEGTAIPGTNCMLRIRNGETLPGHQPQAI